jgi:hypothetical protein
MARNPLATDPETEHRVRERAYYLWESDGRPFGRDIEYWHRARALIGIEDGAGADATPAHPDPDERPAPPPDPNGAPSPPAGAPKKAARKKAASPEAASEQAVPRKRPGTRAKKV